MSGIAGGGPRRAAVYLVDASPYIFRAFHALPLSIVDPGGRPVGAIRGFADFLLRLIDGEAPSHLAVAFDGSLTTSFRNELYPPYKAHRELPPAALEAQVDDCRELAAALGAATFVDPTGHFEADDLIATLAARLAAEPVDFFVVSADKDLAQLVDRRTTLLDFARATRYGPAEVRGKFGVEPGQIVDLLALAGDPVDNIPGVAGVGRTSAAVLLGAFGDLEGIYDRLDEVPALAVRGASALAARLAAGREAAFLSRRLATAARAAPVAARLEHLRLRGADAKTLDPLLERLGFPRWRDRVRRWAEG